MLEILLVIFCRRKYADLHTVLNKLVCEIIDQ